MTLDNREASINCTNNWLSLCKNFYFKVQKLLSLFKAIIELDFGFLLLVQSIDSIFVKHLEIEWK